MVGRVILALWAIVLSSLGTSAAEIECPTADGQEIEHLLAEAPSCERSMDLFRICAYGASGDVGLGLIVREKCEGDFLGKLSKADRRGYDRKIKACERKYARESGTMYRSFEAFCSAAVARDYSRRATMAVRAKRKRR